MLPEEKERTAVHEAGHALVACALPNTDPVHKVTIIPRGMGAMGYVLQRPEDDRFNLTKRELESRIKVALGGTIAEEIFYGEIASGASSDLKKANHIARLMVKELGMSRLGRVFFSESPENPFLAGSLMEGDSRLSEQTAREIDLEVRKIIDDSLEEVRAILKARSTALEALAQRLVEIEVIDGNEVRALLETHYPGPKLVHGSQAIAAPKESEAPEQTDSLREGGVQ
jgi:cell division protease FtsH